MRFATLVAHDLEDTSYTLPDDLPAGPRIVLMPFRRWHQPIVDGWTRILAPLRSAYPSLTVWEVPSISRAYRPAQRLIDGGMRAGIAGRDVRLHTLTAYTDMGALAKDLGIESFGTVQVFLLDGRGEILWQGSGRPSRQAVEEIAAAIRDTAA